MTQDFLKLYILRNERNIPSIRPFIQGRVTEAGG